MLPAVPIALAIVILSAPAGPPAFAEPPLAMQAEEPSQPDLRAQVESLRQQVQVLQERLAALERQLGPAPAPQPSPSTPGAPTSKIFNPDIAVIGNFIGAAGHNAVESTPPLRLNEAELSFQAIVDPYARADVFLSASPDGLEIEEGFATFPTLPGGLLAKVGKLKAQFGKVNTMHTHVLPWTDEPLPLRNLLGGDEGFNDSGVSVSKLILNPVLFLEATGEVYAGSGGPFTGSTRSDLSYNARLRGYRDVTEATNVDIGTSFAYGHNGVTADSTTRLFGVDATVRYRPLRRAIYRRVIARTELFWSRRQQEPGRANAFGAYASGEYQFARRWFAGARYDFSDRADVPSRRDRSGSLLLTYWPSEFSQVRGQFRRTSYAEGVTANEALFQLLFSIGAHGAHVF